MGVERRVVSMQQYRALKRTAQRFEPGQMRSWEQTKPWNLSQEDAEFQRVDGWAFKRQRGSEVASYEKGFIAASPEFFTYPEEVRRAIAYHEAGHAMLEAAGGLRALDDPLGLIDLPGGQALSYNAEEIVAEAYSVLWTEPEWFDRMHADEIRSIVIGLARKAGFPLPPNVKGASLDRNLYWRTHPRGRSFSPTDATSTPFHGGSTQSGYSCFRDPWHLWLYLDAQRWYTAAQDQDIIGFTGTRVGTGNDGEDLVIPDMRTVRRMSLGNFEDELRETPLPSSPKWWGDSPGWSDFASWNNVRRHFSEFSVGDDPVVDRILATAMPSWRGLVNGPVWTEYPGVILVDKTGGGRQSYEVYIDGRQVGRGRTLDDAKEMVEAKIGPCTFQRVRQEPIKTDHYWFGVQDWFGDPQLAYAAIPVA